MTKQTSCTASNFSSRARVFATLFAAIVAIQASPTAASGTPRCLTVPAGVAIEDPATLPPTIFEAVRRELGDLALPDEPFNATDVVEPAAKSRRILFVWHKAERWIVASERGGRGYGNPVLALAFGADSRDAKLVASRTAFPDTLCKVAAALLD